VLGIVAVAAALVACTSPVGPRLRTQPSTTASPDRHELAGAWEPIPAAPGEATGNPVWTGTELVLWSGPTPDNGVARGALAYNPSTRVWRALAHGPLAPTHIAAAVWTGSEIVYWGGFPGYGPQKASLRGEGAALDPATGHWRSIASSPLTPRYGHEAIWTGAEMVVLGGLSACCAIDSVIHEPVAAAYDPTRDTWRTLPAMPPPFSGDGGSLRLERVGDDVLAWRGDHMGWLRLPEGSWEQVEDPVIPRSSCGVTGGPVSTGGVVDGRVLVWTGGCRPEFGLVRAVDRPGWSTLPSSPPGVTRVVAADRWLLGPALVPPPGRDAPYMAEPDDLTNAPQVLAGFDVERERWSTIAMPDDMAIGGWPVWTGSALLVWGGVTRVGAKYARTGAIFRPTS
jgi:hypothetical protein